MTPLSAGTQSNVGERGRQDLCSEEALIYLGRWLCSWMVIVGKGGVWVRIHITVVRGLLGAGQVQCRGGGKEGGKERGRQGVAVQLDSTDCPQLIHTGTNLNLDNQDLSTWYSNEAGSVSRAFAFAVPSIRNVLPAHNLWG